MPVGNRINNPSRRKRHRRQSMRRSLYCYHPKALRIIRNVTDREYMYVSRFIGRGQFSWLSYDAKEDDIFTNAGLCCGRLDAFDGLNARTQ